MTQNLSKYIQKRSTKYEHEENVQKKALTPSTSTSTYLQRPGPGARASSRRLATPGWQQKVGDQSSPSSSSPGNHTSFTSIQLNTMAGGTPGKGAMLIDSLGSVIAANSCLTAADISETVLAGDFEKYCTQGGKTIARDLEKSEIMKVSIPVQLGPNLAKDHHPEGRNKQHQTI